MKKQNLLFKVLFLITTGTIIISILKDLLPQTSPARQAFFQETVKVKMRKVDLDLIKSLIEKGALSDREAMFYEKITNE